MTDVHARTRRLLNGLVLTGTAVVAMIVGHCGGHQLDAWTTPAPEVVRSVPAVGSHAHHLGHAHAAAGAAAAGPHAGHGALLPVASGAFLLAVTAGLALLLTVRHRSRLRVAPVRSLLAAQLLAFVVLEAAQRQLSLELWVDAATDRRTWLGLALQPAVAWFVHRVGRRTAAAAAELLAAPVRPRLTGLTSLGVVAVPRLLGPSDGALTRALARGPPCERLTPT